MSDIKWRAGEVEWEHVHMGLMCPQGHYSKEVIRVVAREDLPCPACEELASLREDKARLDWMDSVDDPYEFDWADDARAAIDAARKETEDE